MRLLAPRLGREEDHGCRHAGVIAECLVLVQCELERRQPRRHPSLDVGAGAEEISGAVEGEDLEVVERGAVAAALDEPIYDFLAARHLLVAPAPMGPAANSAVYGMDHCWNVGSAGAAEIQLT